MTASLVAYVLKAGLIIWLALLMAIVLGRVLRGTISLRGILSEDAAKAGDETSAPRAIAMLVFPLVIMILVLSALNFDPTDIASGMRPSFPEIPDNLVILLIGGNGVYLAGKLNAFRNGVAK